MAEMFYVVLGEHGEYSDRDVWVSGIYTDIDAAKAEVERRLAMHREHAAWHDNYCQVIRRIHGNVWRTPTNETESAALKMCPPKPPFEPAERCAILSVPLNEWGRWNEFDHEAA